jgi:hypothetical protein
MGWQWATQPGAIFFDDFYPLMPCWRLAAVFERAANARLIDTSVVAVLATWAEQ